MIIGPNGAGKTTLLRAIAGLLRQKDISGEVFFDGVPVSQLSKAGRSQLVAYVPQRPVFPPQMKLADYVLLGRTPHISTFASESKADRAEAQRALFQTGMEWAADRRLHTLSGGEAQLGAVARALATRAPLILLDEPTASLDLGNRLNVLNLIYSLKDVAILSTMHDLQLAGRADNRLILMAEGSVRAEGSPEEVLSPVNISKYYGVSAKIIKEEKGVTVVPQH